MTQTSSSTHDLSPEDAERFAAAFRPSWEIDEPSNANGNANANMHANANANVQANVLRGATLPLGLAGVAAHQAAVEGANRAGQGRTLAMAAAPPRADASAPLPSFDLPVSAPKLPPAPVSVSDVAKTSVYKPVNAADIDFPDDDIAPAKKKNTALFAGIGIAAVLAVVAGVGFGMSQSGEGTNAAPTSTTTAPAATTPPKPTAADIPAPGPADTAPPKAAATPGMNEPKTPAKAPPEPKIGARPEPRTPAKPPAAAGAPLTPARPGGAPAKPGGIVRDAPF